ncbi:MAG: hypothetical protein E7812_03960 [Phenylobacterium sp.]|nr:MAG: hypothetical protein E7812_03960 [Phenylobacterium sp.]
MAATPNTVTSTEEATDARLERGVARAAGVPRTAKTHAGGEQKAQGLPQFDTTQWGGQAVWFLIIFGVVLALMRFVFVPRIGGAIEARESKISGDISEARRLKDEADAQAAAAAAETAQARAEALKVASDARTKAQAEIAATMAVEEARIGETMAKAEAEIAAARDAAMGNVRGIAVDAARAIVEKLTGKAPSAGEVDAAVAGRA